jgi:LPS-assembly protein
MQQHRSVFYPLILPITLAALCHSFCAVAEGQAPAANFMAPAGSREDVDFQADRQFTEGRWRYLRGHVEIHKEQMTLTADEVDYDEETGDAHARGSVHFVYPSRKEDVYASRFDYNLDNETGMFYNVRGTVSSASQGNPRILTTTEPFYFQGESAQKIRDHYVVFNGFVTDCKVPHPWWTLGSPRVTVVPGEYALMRHPVFRLRRIPLFYAPAYYKSLKRMPRNSGFLTPNIGNSSSRGRVLGESFFWAINRSADLTLGFTYFSARGIADHVAGRLRPTRTSHFDYYWYQMNDRGIGSGANVVRQGGFLFTAQGRTDLPWGFRGLVNVNYLSSLEFRLAFSETLNEAIFSEAHSVGFATKTFSTYFLNVAMIRNETFLTTAPHDNIVIRKFPGLEFDSGDHELLRGPVPLWFSFDAAGGLLGRKQPGFQTRELTDRFDFFPRLSTRFAWKGLHLTPSFGVDETYYGERLRPDGSIQGQDLLRSARVATLELDLPPLERVFHGPKLLGDKLKHVIEPKATYRYVTGISDFDKVIRFDERDLLTNTNEIELSLTNRFYAKKESSGEVREVLTVDVRQRRYFDPTFGGALVPGARNVFLSTADLTPFAFADTPRPYSPVVSTIRVQPRWNYAIEWRNDYDPLRGKLADSGIAGDVTVKSFGFSIGDYVVRSDPILTPHSNQLRTTIRWGSLNKRGWNLGTNMVYDYRIHVLQYANAQVTYNTDCCGFSVEWRRFSLGTTRNENQFRLALSIANIGSFGNLKKQEKMF